MKKITFTISLLILITCVWYARQNHWFDSPTAFAVGDLTVNWGVPEGNPIFTITNASPGHSDDQNVAITNNSSSTKQLGIRTQIDSVSPSNYPEVLNIKIMEGASILYQNSLENFISDSSGVNGLSLGLIASGQTRNINVEITFDVNAGNDFQNANITFDLIIGIFIEVPLACQNINFNGSTIFGTEGNDNILGTSKSELIVVFEGNDSVLSGSGNDCIVGLSGIKKISAGNGNDVVIVGDGDNKIALENGVDVVEAGNGNNEISAGAGNDIVKAGNGNNKISSEAGDDIVEVGTGVNNISLGAGNDRVTAQGGNNNISGESGNDNINNGSTATGTVNGASGRDTCIALIKTLCEL